MSFYQEVITELRNDDFVRDYYRFQGANSLANFDIRTSRFKETDIDSYVYFSQALDHHKYFILKTEGYQRGKEKVLTLLDRYSTE